MSKNSKENENWKRNWLSISSEKSIYNNEIPYKNDTLEPDICHGYVVVNFVTLPANIQKIKEETNMYSELGYKVIWVINLISEYERGNFICVRDEENEVLFEYAYGYNNILNNMANILNKCDVYFEINEKEPLFKLNKNSHERMFWVNKKDRMSKLDIISKLVFGYWLYC